MEENFIDYLVRALTFGKIVLPKIRHRKSIKRYLKDNKERMERLKNDARKINPQLLKIGTVYYVNSYEYEEFMEYFYNEVANPKKFILKAKFNKENEEFEALGGEILVETENEETRRDLILFDIKTKEVFYCDTRLFKVINVIDVSKHLW